MKYLSAVAVAAWAAVAAAQNPDPAEPPPAPAGFKSVSGKDQTYQFLFPDTPGRTGSRERTVRNGRLAYKTQIHSLTTPDGVTYVAEAISLGGAAVRGATAGDIHQLLMQGDKADGFTLSAPAEVAVGKEKGVGYTASKAGESRRVVLVGGRPRLFALSVSGPTPASTTTPAADTFLSSLVLTAKPAVVKADPADPGTPADPATAGKPAGPAWTLSAAKMAIPEAPASGRVKGGDFAPDAATLEPTGLTLRQGPGFFPDASINLVLFKAPADLAGQSAVLAPRGPVAGVPHIRLSRKGPTDAVPQTDVYTTGYTLKLAFGPIKDGKVAGQIYVCFPDAGKSVVAGTFEAVVK